jgi:hypothetical protein
MNKKQKISVILGLILILFLSGTFSLVKAVGLIDLPNNIDNSQPVGPGPTQEQINALPSFQDLENQMDTPQSAVTESQSIEPPPFAPDLTQGGNQIKTTSNYIMIVQYIAGTIGGFLVQCAAYLTTFALDLNSKILDTNYNPYVISGWRISRDVANLGFVLFIIIIAIATILRYQEYAAKSTLAKLIAVALLVNFSLLGAGVFVDFSNMLTNFFINGATGGSSIGLATAITENFNPQRFLQVKDQSPENASVWSLMTGLISGAFKAILSWIASLFFVIIFTLLLAFVLFALAIMFLIRFVMLDILLVLVPLACLFWVIPATKNLWDKWWHEFMRWVLFAPVATFFLFLAVKMAENTSKLQSFNQSTGSAGLDFKGLANAGFLSEMASGVVLVGFVLGGLIVANSMSITGAKTFYGWAQQAGKWAKGTAGSLSQRTAQRLAMTGSKEKAGEVTTRGQRFAAAISRVPGFRRVGQKLSAFSAPQARAEEVEKYRKDNLVNLSNDGVINQALNPAIRLDRRAEAAVAQELAKRDLIKDSRITPVPGKVSPLLERLLKTSQSMGNINTVLNNRPDLAASAVGLSMGLDIKKVMAKIRADKADEISHDAFKDVDVVSNLSQSHLDRLGRVGETRQKDAILQTITQKLGVYLDDIKDTRRDIEKTIKEIEDAQKKGDNGLATKLIDDRKNLEKKEKSLISGLTPEDQKLLKHYTFISKNINWQA